MDKLKTYITTLRYKLPVSRIIKRSVYFPFALIGIILFVIGFLTFQTVFKSPAMSLAGTEEKISIAKPKATQVINREFQYPLKDGKGKEVSKIRYVLESAEIRDELIVKGKLARAIEGREFLVLKIKIINDFTSGIEVSVRDYVRLSVNKAKDKYAADVHNDPVEIQAGSTKPTRLAFPINESDKNIVLYVGEINGKKEELKLTIK